MQNTPLQEQRQKAISENTSFNAMLLAGNAGGVLAVLSFLGTVYGKTGTAPRSAFWILVVFVVGAASSYIYRQMQVFIQFTYLKLLELPELEAVEAVRATKKKGLERRRDIYDWIAVAASGLSSGALIAGTLLGLQTFYRFTTA